MGTQNESISSHEHDPSKRTDLAHKHTPKKMFCSTVLIAALAATQGASASGTRQLQISLGSTLHTFDSAVAQGLSTIGPKALGIKSPPFDIASGVQHAFHH